MKNLKASQKYNLKVVSSAGNVDVKINGVIQQPKVEYSAQKTIFSKEYFFKATDKDMTLEITKSVIDAKKTVYLHYVSVMPYIGE